MPTDKTFSGNWSFFIRFCGTPFYDTVHNSTDQITPLNVRGRQRLPSCKMIRFVSVYINIVNAHL